MINTPHNSQPAPYRRIIGALISLVLLGLMLAGWYVHTAGFHAWVRARVIAAVEHKTGGQVELEALTWNLAKLEFEARHFTIHGLEGSEEIPYLSVDRLQFRLKLLSLLRPKVGLRYVELDRPVLHVIVYPNGSTNQPLFRRTNTDWIDVDANRAEVHGGVILVNQQALPLDLTAENLSLTLAWDASEARYDGSLRVGKVATENSVLGTLAPGVQTHFAWWKDRVRFDSLEISAGQSHLQASGGVSNFRQPEFDLTYSAVLDAAQFSPLLRAPGWRAGRLSLDGQADGTMGSGFRFSSSGKAGLQGLEYAGRDVRLPSLSGTADFKLTEQELVVPQIFLRLLGGTVTGNAQVRNWNRTLPPLQTSDGRASSPSGQTGAISLQAHNLALADILRAVSTRSRRLDEMKAVGAVGGSIGVRWQGLPANFISDFSLETVPPASPAPTELPLQGQLRGSYDNAAKRIRLASLNLLTGATHLSASGTLSVDSRNLQFALDTPELNRWLPLVTLLGGPTRMPLEVHGRTLFRGSLSGHGPLAVVAGRLQIFDFDSLIGRRGLGGMGAAASPVSEGPRVRWDALTANLEYSSGRIAVKEATLKRGPGQVKFDFSAPVENGGLATNSPFSAQATMVNVDVGDVLLLTGCRCPLTGVLNGSLRFAGTPADPQGTANLLSNNGLVYGQPVKRIQAEGRLSGHEIQATAFELVQNGGTARGNGSYNIATGAFRFTVRGTNFSLAKMPWWQSNRTAITGSLSFTAQGNGTPEVPGIQATVQLSDVVMNGERVGGFYATAETTDGLIRLSGHSEFRQSDLELAGTIRPHEDWPAKLELQFHRLDADPLLRMFLAGGITGHSALAGTVSAEIPLASPRDLTLSAAIDQFSADIENVQLTNEGPIRFSYSQRTIRVDQLHLSGTDTTLDVSGRAQLDGRQALDVRARGQVNLKLLESLNPSVMSSGLITVDLRVSGTVSRPFINGRVDVTEASLSAIDLPNGLSGLNGRLLFTQDRLQIQELNGKTGSGELAIEGFVTYGPGIVFNLRGRGHDIRLRYPPGMSAIADSDLRLTGSAESALLSGDITISRFGLNRDFDLGTYLARAQETLTTPVPSSPLAHLRLDVHIGSPPELQVQTSLAKLSGDVDLRLRGTGVHPVLLGRINVIEGEVSFNGTKYHLQRGSVILSNPVTIQPVLDFEATTAVRDYDIAIGLHGPTDKLSTTYRSEPPLATADIISLLAFGRTREQTAAQSPQSINAAPETQTVLYQALNAAVSSRMQKLFGVSHIKIDPQAAGLQNTTSPRLTIEQQVANNLTLTYLTDVARANYQTIQAEYNLSHNVSIVAMRDWNGVVSFDIRIRQRRR